MKMNRRSALLFAAVVLVAVSSSGCGYNTLVTKQQNVKRSWADVESRLQRRADLIPNMIATAQSAGVQEQEVFGQIADANSRLINATRQAPQGEGGDKTPEQKQAVIDAANSFGGTIGRLLSLQQTWPQLRSSELFLKVQDELAGTENRINVAREDYNAAVQDYNTTRSSFPTVIGAKMYGFKEEPYFKAQEGAQQVPRIDPNAMRRDQGRSAPKPQPAGSACGFADNRMRVDESRRCSHQPAFCNRYTRSLLLAVPSRSRASCTRRNGRRACRRARPCRSSRARRTRRVRRRPRLSP